MAVSWSVLEILDRAGLIARGGALLDIGTSNLYAADTERVVRFFREHGCSISPDVFAFAEELTKASGKNPDGSAINEAWLGQVIEAIGMEYDSIDIAVGYKTRTVDLNRDALPSNMVNHFDAVINCGTTEHILNQFNAFRAIHDATKVGGHIFHQVPATGHTDHGYFCYTSRFFLDLAGYNKYEVVDFWIDGPDRYDKMYTGMRSYAMTFPKLQEVLNRIPNGEREARIEAMEVPNNSINVIFRKTHAQPFMGMVEISTSWGAGGAHDVNNSILERYT